MPKTYSGTFISNGDGTGTWKLSNGDQGTFRLVDYKINSDGSLSYRQQFIRSNGSTLGEVKGLMRGDLASNSGRYSGTWTLTKGSNGLYTYNNFKNGKLFSSGGFQTSGDPFPKATYTLTPSATSINEGQTLTTTLRTQGVAAGTRLYYALSGKVIDAADFSAGALTGSLIVGANGTLSIAHTLAEDKTTEGAERVSIRLFSDANRKQQVGNTATVSVGDTSTTPVAIPTTDSVTGQKLIFSDLGTIENHKTYGKEGYRWIQPIVNNDGFTKESMDKLTDFKIKFDFSDKYIIATISAKGESRSSWINK